MRYAGALAVAVLLAACTHSDDPGGVSAPPSGELIAFSRGDDVAADLYVMRPDGTGVRQLTRSRADDAYPAWSPDGRRLAFTSNQHRGGDDLSAYELYVVDRDGTDLRRLTDNRIAEFRLQWTGDDRLAFTSCWSDDDARACRLETLRPDGSDRRRVLGAPPEAAMLYGTAVSPDGSKLAFARPRLWDRPSWLDEDSWLYAWRNTEIYASGPDGSGERRLTWHPGNDLQPAWSRDGSRIVFESDRDRNGDCVFHECAGYAAELYVVNVDGTGLRRLTRTRASEAYPAWSPDGTRIVFARTLDDEEDDFELYVMNADGSCVTQLTDNTAEDEMPSWTGSGGGPLEC
jgi:TolB protein